MRSREARCGCEGADLATIFGRGEGRRGDGPLSTLDTPYSQPISSRCCQMSVHEDENLDQHGFECKVLGWDLWRSRRGSVVPCERRQVEDEREKSRRADGWAAGSTKAPV